MKKKGINSNFREVKVPKEQAIKEFQEFYEFHKDEEISVEEVEESYKQSLKAIMNGRLIFEDIEKFKLTLRNPIKDDQGEIFLAEISSVRTRIKPTDSQRIFKNINAQTDAMGFLLRSISYITGQESVMFDKISKHDYSVIQELIPLFL